MAIVVSSEFNTEYVYLHVDIPNLGADKNTNPWLYAHASSTYLLDLPMRLLHLRIFRSIGRHL